MGAVTWVVWNTSLAVIPVGLGYLLYHMAYPSVRRATPARKASILLLGLAWLAFVPNTCYLLTEWRHFLELLGFSGLEYRWQHDPGATVELMMHTLFYLAYSAIGMLTFALAVRPVARLFREHGADMWVWGVPFFLVTSVGVYLGLVLRFNSWEMLTRSADVWAAVLSIAYKPLLASFVIAFAAFLWLGYWIMDIWVDGFLVRYRAITGN